jgi:hypothetical protein
VSPSSGEWVGGGYLKTGFRKLNFESVNSLNWFGVVPNKPLALSALEK